MLKVVRIAKLVLAGYAAYRLYNYVSGSAAARADASRRKAGRRTSPRQPLPAGGQDITTRAPDGSVQHHRVGRGVVAR